MEKISRFGAYGILLQDEKILLTLKKAGPFQGLWDLPGGGIEFEESPEITLQRELLEEVAIRPESWDFLYHSTHTQSYTKNEIVYGYHQLGAIYKVKNWDVVADAKAQEEYQWLPVNNLDTQHLTPLARDAVSFLLQHQSWRPNDKIRGKAVAIVKKDDCILVCEVRDDHGSLKGWVPPGGGIEFCETAQETLCREIAEEIGCTIQIHGPYQVFENIFDHQGFKGHEIVFAFRVTLDNEKIYKQARFPINEASGNTIWLEWIPISRFLNHQDLLFPNGILTALEKL